MALTVVARGTPAAVTHRDPDPQYVSASIGRFAEARAAYRRGQSIFTAAGARFEGALCAIDSGRVELIARDYAAAERHLREANEAFRAMGERAWRATTAALLAQAAYEQGHHDQALQLTEEAEALAPVDDDTQSWRAIRAKLLAGQGQFRAAARLADEAVALLPAAIDMPERAEFLMAKAEVSRLAGALDEAEESLRRALEFYAEREWVPLAEQARAQLAGLTAQRRTRTRQ